MYLSHYRLQKKPFDISPDPSFLWLGEKHREALAYLKYGILENKGFLMITGDVGTGKTALIKRLVRLIDAATFVVTIPDPDMSKLDFFNFLADELEMGRTFNSKGEFLIHFKHFLKSAYSEHRKVLLIIDESQRLNHELLQEIRLLSNIDLGGQVLLNIFFVGQTEFHQLLKEERNRTVRQRITASFHLEPLNAGEVKNYIIHRLRVAGATSQIFTDEAIRRIFQITSGYPRLINILCDHALMTGYSSGASAVLPAMVDECARELSITFGHRIDTAANRNKLDPDPIPAAEIDPAVFPGAEPDSDEASTRSTEEVVKRMAQDAADSKRSFLRPFALAFAVLLMLFGMVYFAFGPVREYVAGTILQESEPPPLASFASDDAIKEAAPPSSGGVQNQSSVIAVPKAEAEVPTAYKSSGESGTAKNEEPGDADDSPGQPVTLQKAEPAAGLASSQLQTDSTTETAPDALNTAPVTDSGSDALQAAVQKESVISNTAGTADDTSSSIPTASDSEGNTPKTPAMDFENELVMVGDAQRAIIFFHHDSHNLPEQAGAKLRRLLETALRSPSARISIMGYTDSLGNEWYNRKLSQTRADIVRDFFIARGIEPEKIRAVGMGDENPLASNDTSDGRRKNRRVEVYIGSAVN
jgi:type II secretory pathway predicted ATPase ExeA/outer membrane protein OmpA-like peptidoglycan-associated protein